MQEIINTLQNSFENTLPGLIGALGILIIGWLVAVVARAGVHKLLDTLNLNERIAEQTGNRIDVESGAAKTVFWLIILFVLIAFFNALDLGEVSGPLDTLLQQVMGFLPKIIAASILALVAWILAFLARMGTAKALKASNLDEKLSLQAGMEPMSASVSQALFWIIILLFIPAILGTLQLGGLLEPVQNMVDKALAMLPNIVAGVVLGVVGWFIARILSNLVTNLSSAAGADALGLRAGLAENISLSKLLGTLVFIFVFIPALIGALHALKIDAISGPATDMLGQIMAAIPNILAAAVILALTYYVARFASQLVTSLLEGIGADNLPEKLGVAGVFSGNMAPAKLGGTLVMFFGMLFAVVEAANRLGFDQVSHLVGVFIHLGGQILLGAVILAVGVWLANLAHGAISRTEAGAAGMAGLARIAIIGLVAAMGLRAMGIADDIVNLAFGLTLGAVAVATALSFGLGGREAAGKQMEYWLEKLRRD